MITMSKLAVVATILATSIATPAFAQAFDGDYGTGNTLPSYYDQSGALHAGVAAATPVRQNRIGTRRSGLNAFAMAPSAADSRFSPAARGGGSLGYNENMRLDQW